jgi:predicted RNase H-like HicB family nuclease
MVAHPSSWGNATLVLGFTGHYESDDQYVYAVCDQIPLTVPGRDEREADTAMDHAIALYVETLSERGELQAAINKFGIQVTQLPIGRFSPLRWGIRPTPSTGRVFGTLITA